MILIEEIYATELEYTWRETISSTDSYVDTFTDTTPPVYRYTTAYSYSGGVSYTFRANASETITFIPVGTNTIPTHTQTHTLFTSTTGDWTQLGEWQTTQTTLSETIWTGTRTTNVAPSTTATTLSHTWTDTTSTFNSTSTVIGTVSTQTTYSTIFTYKDMDRVLKRMTMLGEDEVFVSLTVGIGVSYSPISNLSLSTVASISLDELDLFTSHTKRYICNTATTHTLKEIVRTFTIETIKTTNNSGETTTQNAYLYYHKTVSFTANDTFTSVNGYFYSEKTYSFTDFCIEGTQVKTTTLHGTCRDTITLNYDVGFIAYIPTQASRTIEIKYNVEKHFEHNYPVYDFRDDVFLGLHTLEDDYHYESYDSNNDYVGEVYVFRLMHNFAPINHYQPLQTAEYKIAPYYQRNIATASTESNTEIYLYERSDGSLFKTAYSNTNSSGKFVENKFLGSGGVKRINNVSDKDNDSAYTFTGAITDISQTIFTKTIQYHTAYAKSKELDFFLSSKTFILVTEDYHHVLNYTFQNYCAGLTESVNPKFGGITPETYKANVNYPITLLFNKPIDVGSCMKDERTLDITNWTQTGYWTDRSEATATTMFESQKENFTTQVSIDILQGTKDLYVEHPRSLVEVFYNYSFYPRKHYNGIELNFAIIVLPKTGGHYDEIQRY